MPAFGMAVQMPEAYGDGSTLSIQKLFGHSLFRLGETSLSDW